MARGTSGGGGGGGEHRIASSTNTPREIGPELSDAACDILRSLPHLARGGFVFFGRKRGQHLKDLEFPWRQALKRAKLRHIRIHDLRHTIASHLVSNGESLHIVGKLLGHTLPQTTARYAHLADRALRDAANKFSTGLKLPAWKM